MGPLKGFKIVELAGIGPSQLCGMLLADMGATVMRIDRPRAADLGFRMPAKFDLMNRSRPTIAVDLKSARGVELVLRLCASGDALFEGYRPGVMEKFGLGPTECMARNPKLIYGRMTGWGQSGPLATSVGHDANYVALSGALHAMGAEGSAPPIPLNLIGDFGGGALYLAVGILAALLEAGRSGQGQIVDAAMVDGVANMLTMYHGLMAGGLWQDRRQRNLLDGGAPFVRSYQTKDDKFIVISAIENRFFKELLDLLDLEEIDAAEQYDVQQWERYGRIFADLFRGRTRDEWCALLEGSGACFAPVLSLAEAPAHAHNAARSNYVDVDGMQQPAPAPRFSRTPTEIQSPPTENYDPECLREWGFSASDIKGLVQDGVLVSQQPPA